jgi:N-methylhydantoinase B
MMREFELETIDELARHILDTSRAATRAAIGKLPQGEYRATTMLDGYESPIQLKVRMTIGSGDITVDYAGSSGASERGINSPKCYTDAVFGVRPEMHRCAGDPE